MQGFGVAERTDPETYLRLACERLMVSQDRRGGSQQGGELPVVGRALMAGGLLDDERVHAVLEEYAFAFGLREQGGWWHMHHMSAPEARGRRLTADRVFVGHLEFGDSGERRTLERVVFGEDQTAFDLSGVTSTRQGPSAMALRRNHMFRRTLGPPGLVPGGALTVGDDRGTTTPATVGHSGSSGQTWHSHFTTDVPLSAATAWIEIDGVRLDLPEPPPVPDVRMEMVETIDPVRAMLFGEIVGSGNRWHGGENSVDVAIETLIATGALEEDDPMVKEAERVGAAFVGGGATANLPQPWAALMRRWSRSDGPVGVLALGAVVEALEGCSIRFDSLTSDESSFSVALAVSPGLPLMMHFPGFKLERSPIDWWAEDDRGNAYLLMAGAGSASDDVAEGTIESISSLDPTAIELRLLPTGTTERAVVTIPLGDLGGRK
jgi:hypothetical protein